MLVPAHSPGDCCVTHRQLCQLALARLAFAFGRAMLHALLCVILLTAVQAQLTLKSNFRAGQEYPSDHRGDEDNISPPLSWTGVPKNTESYVLIVDSENAGSKAKSGKRKDGTHWLVYDIPKDVHELREELSGAGSSDVSRLGMKEDAGQAPVVCHRPPPLLPSPLLVRHGAPSR